MNASAVDFHEYVYECEQGHKTTITAFDAWCHESITCHCRNQARVLFGKCDKADHRVAVEALGS